METKAPAPQDKIAVLKSSAEKKFELVQKEATELQLKSERILITDENTLAIATQTLSSVAEMDKKIDSKRKEMKAPYVEAGKIIDEIAKRITSPLEEAKEKLKVKLKKWNDDQEAKRQELAKASMAKLTLLRQIEEQLKQKIELCHTPEACDKLIASINEKFPPASKFADYAEEAKTSKANFIKILELRRASIVSSTSGDTAAASEAIEAIAEISKATEENSAIAEDKHHESVSSSVSKSKTRKVWKIEVVDESKLPKQFLSFDEKKARAYMNANKEKWNKEAIVGGVRFYEDHDVIA